MNRKPLTKKVLCLGLDAMDPRSAKKYLRKGKMPNLQQLIDRGSCREDLVLLGAMPTVTPPQWTTLACGCYPQVHSVTAFYRQGGDLDRVSLNLDSRNCAAEQLWNVTAEAGYKTLVMHWPGSAWPPSSDSPNLHVIDGTSPGTVNVSSAQVDPEYLLVANEQTAYVTFRTAAASNSSVPCLVTGLDENMDDEDLKRTNKAEAVGLSTLAGLGADFPMILMTRKEAQGDYIDLPMNVALSPIKPVDHSKWANAPQDAKEITMLFSGGMIRRPALILKNEDGIYDRLAIYKTKKDAEPMAVLNKREYFRDFFDESMRGDTPVKTNRDMFIMELAEDGSSLKMWISASMNMGVNVFWHPNSLYDEVVAEVGYPPANSTMGGGDRDLIGKCMYGAWEHCADWTAGAMNYLIEKHDYDVIFSHFHSPDMQKHLFIREMKNGRPGTPPEVYEGFMEGIYTQIDRYIGKFMHLLDKDWTILLVSDHGQVCSAHGIRGIGDMGTNIEFMRELGLCEVLKDEDGNDLRAIDWSKTTAVATREMHIYLNLKGRHEHGIIDPEDQFEVEEEIISKLYEYRDPITNKRIISLALRRQDAKLIGLGGEYPQCGDIIYAVAQGYEHDHEDSLSTSIGECETSVSPIFVAAGPGIKEGFITDRDIRQVDVAPTMAVLLGTRMPAQCEGAPVYQIFTEEV